MHFLCISFGVTLLKRCGQQGLVNGVGSKVYGTLWNVAGSRVYGKLQAAKVRERCGQQGLGNIVGSRV